MATGLFNWNRTPANNANATYNFAEGMAPSAVNDSARGIMSDVAQYRDDIAGAIVTSGTSTAYTVTSYSIFTSLALMNGQMIAFTPHTTNGSTVTLTVDGLGAKPLRSAPSTELQAGTLIQGTPYVATYNNSDGAWYLQNFFGNPYNVPLAAGMDYWGTTAPNSSFVFPIGQQISQTTYATLYAAFGPNRYGADGGGLFFLPDKTGRVSAMKEVSATRLTSAGSGINGATLGAANGLTETQTLTLAQLPTGITSANAAQAISVTGPSGHTLLADGTVVGSTTGGGGTPINVLGTPGSFGSGFTFTGNNSIGVTSNNTSGSAHPIVQPTIVCNYIIRVL